MKNPFPIGYRLLLVFILFSCCFSAFLPSWAGERFFQDGKTDWSVCVTPADDPTLQFAAVEFQRALRLISGADFPLVAEADISDVKTVHITVEPTLAETPDKIRVEVRDGNLFLTGGSPRSALYAVYDFLQKELDARWLWPGEEGEFLPTLTQWELPKIEREFTPPVRYRGFHMCGDWYRVEDFHLWMTRNQQNIHRHGHYNFPDVERGFYRMYSSHNIYPPKEYFATNPEFYALRNGNRLHTQVCLSNPECLRVVADKLTEELKQKLDQKQGIDILSLFLPDNQEYCQCEKCAKKSVSTAYFDFYSSLTDILKERFPDLKFAALAYQGYLDVPENPVRNSEFVEIATHGRCNIHLYGDPNCERNARELERFADWKASGVSIGNYAYEYDVFSGDELFLPIFSVMADVVETNLALDSVVLIPEVSLSPKSGPEEKVGAFANRVTAYMTARLMVEPDADWHEILKDYCRHAFGPAASEIYDYFMILDQKWISLDTHRGILGKPTVLAGLLLTPEVLAQVNEKLATATRIVEGVEVSETLPEAQKNRFRANVTREKVLLQGWIRYLDNSARLEVPHVVDALAPTAGTRVFDLNAHVAWTDAEIVVKDFSLPMEIALTTGLSGETWFFRVDENGKKSQAVLSDVGVRDNSWNVKWSLEGISDGKVCVARIPFTSLPTDAPSARALWQFRLTEGEKSFPKKSEPMAGFSFSAASQTHRPVAYWPGTRQRDAHGDQYRRTNFRDMGWTLTIAQSEAEFLAQKPVAYWLKNPTWSENPLSDAGWEKVREDVKNGAVAVFHSYSALPLEKYFEDPTFAVKVGGSSGPITLQERRSNFIQDGNWCKTPNDLTRSLQREITPAYHLTLANPERWVILATMPKSSQELDERLVYLAIRRYGKGAVLVMGADPRFSYPGILENILENLADFQEK